MGAVEEILELMADLHMKPRNLLPTFVHNGSICREAAMEIVLLLVLYGANVANENDALLHAAFQGTMYFKSMLLCNPFFKSLQFFQWRWGVDVGDLVQFKSKLERFN